MEGQFVHDTAVNKTAAEKWRTPKSKELYKNPKHTYDQSTFDYHQDDIVIAAFPRNGTHMAWHICRWLVQGHTRSVTDAWEESLITYHSFKDNQTHLDHRVLCTHLLPNAIGHSIIRSGKIKIIFVYRNPKDSCVSLYNLYADHDSYTHPGEFKDYAVNYCTDYEQIYAGCWTKTMLAWEEFTNRYPDALVLPVSFERLVRNTRDEIKRIADFCEIEAPEALLSDIVHMSSFQNMTKLNDISAYKQSFKDGTPTYFRKGKIGDWKNWFTVALSERFDEELKKRISNLKYQIIYE